MDITTYPLRAPLDRVRDAISDAGHFGFWFGAEIDGQFAPGAVLIGRVIPTRAHPGIGRAQRPYLGTAFEISIVSVKPARRFSFRWHPAAAAPGNATLVSFELDEAAIGTSITITESGHDDPAGTPAGPLVSGGLWRALVGGEGLSVSVERVSDEPRLFDRVGDALGGHRVLEMAGVADQRPARPERWPEETTQHRLGCDSALEEHRNVKSRRRPHRVGTAVD